MLRKGLAVIPEYGPAGHVSAHRYINVLSHRGEPPYLESTTKQVDVVKRLNGLSFCVHCSAPGFLDSGLTVFASTLPRPARRGHVAPERDFDSGISPASTARCTFA